MMRKGLQNEEIVSTNGDVSCMKLLAKLAKRDCDMLFCEGSNINTCNISFEKAALLSS
jgi:hypothetical protein